MRTRNPMAESLSATAVCSWGQPAFVHQPPAVVTPPPPVPVTYAFQDEFNGPAGSLPDASKWLWDAGPGASIGGNNETETYVKSAANSYLDGNGHLVIAVTPGDGGGFNSARLKSNFHQLFGHWEARIALPNVPGCWPAFWFLGQGSWPGCGEIDVVESYGTGFTDSTIWNSTAGANKNGRLSNQMDGGFHVYRLDWAKGSVKVYIDNVLCNSATSETLTPWPFDANGGAYCLLNIATGGTGTGGVNPHPALLPAKMVVDYVRCWSA
jgi:beta-glucanase (GH16 family)